MNLNLKKASESDKRKLKAEIMPISKIDSLIVSEIITALKDINEIVLANILNKYKLIPDQQVFEELRRYNINFAPEIKVAPVSGEEEEAQPPKNYFIIINETYYFKVSWIVSIRKDILYKGDRIEFRLILNEDTVGKLFYANTIIPFITQQAMEYELGMVKKKLEQFDVTFL